MITKVFPDWYKVNIDILHHEVSEREQWCKDNIGFSDHDTWVYVRTRPMQHGHFSFKDEDWALMFALRWA
jgi:hypothetical protein